MRNENKVSFVWDEFFLVIEGCVRVFRKSYNENNIVRKINQKFLFTILAFLTLSFFPSLFQSYAGNDCVASYISSQYLEIVFNIMFSLAPVFILIFFGEIYPIIIIGVFVAFLFMANVCYFIPRCRRVSFYFKISNKNDEVFGLNQILIIPLRYGSVFVNIIILISLIGSVLFSIFPAIRNLKSETNSISIFFDMVQARKQAKAVCDILDPKSESGSKGIAL